MLENNKSQGLKITATTFTNTIKEISHKAVSYKVSSIDKCSCDFGEVPPPPMLLGCVSIPNTKNCYLLYEVVEGGQVGLRLGFLDPVKRNSATFYFI